MAAILSASSTLSAEGLPPIIDRELLFGNPEISGAQISPDGKYIAFVKPWENTRNVWVKKTDEPFSTAKLLTTETKRPISGYLWSRDGKYVIYVKDTDGDENFNVFAVDPAEETPASRDLTGLKGVRIELYSAPKNDPDIAFIGVNDRDPAWHDLYKLRISTGERTLVRLNTENVAGWFFDELGQLRLASRVTDSGEQELLRVDADALIKVYSCSVFEGFDPIRYHKDGKRVYMETNKGDDVDLTALVLFNPATGTLETVESDPLKQVDFGGALFSDLTDELVLTRYEGDRVRRYFKDTNFEDDYEWLRNELPGREVGLGSHTNDENVWLVSASGDTEPGATYLFDRAARKLTQQYVVREKLPREALSPMLPIRYPSSDGLEIPAYLTLPVGIPSKNLPTIVVPHGGPWARDAWGFDGESQFFANRGYAVLSPNFRGSTGFGKNFLNAGNGEWGRKMQDDITWGVKYLIAEGIADPLRIGILGGSYGGYATLAGVAYTPDIYRAAVDIVGPSNLLTLLDSIPPYWEAGRKIMYARMADPGTPEGNTWLEERSPLNSADQIKTPLMVVQGANDPRVNRGEAEQIVIALRDRNFPVEYILAPDEGHGFHRPVNNMAMYMAVEKFLAQQLGGRYQEGGTPDVMDRLKEITVDVNTVVITKKLDATSVGTPQPVAELQAGTRNYNAKLLIGGQEIALKIVSTVVDENNSWTATDTVETPMGPMSDMAVIDKGTLLIRKRTVTQNPMVANMDFTDAKVSGTMEISGKGEQFSRDMTGPVFADSAASRDVIGCLPLAVDYEATYRNFDVQKQKEKLMQLKVLGVETVTVPAGSFEAIKVDISSADGGADQSTVWIEKDSRKAVKWSAVMPELGGAVLTAELSS